MPMSGTSRPAVTGAVGCRADLTAFTVDPVEAPADELGQAPIRLTLLDASITHQ
jgi:hypothetical protein